MEKQINIQVPEGFEIDVDNSNLKKGIIKFKQIEKKLPESWEELENVKGYSPIYNETKNTLTIDVGSGYTVGDQTKNIFPTKEEAEASIALAQLCQLRDRYNGCNIKQLYTPDCYVYEYEDSDENRYKANVLIFKTHELRTKFISCPEIVKLINIAKPLL